MRRIPRPLKLVLALILPVLLGSILWRVTRPDIRPRRLKDIPRNISRIEVSPAGRLYVLSGTFGDAGQYFETEIDPQSGASTTRKVGANEIPTFSFNRSCWYAEDGTRIIHPGHYLNGFMPRLCDPHTMQVAPRTLRLVYRNGTIRQLASIGKFVYVSSVVFHPDGHTVSIIGDDTLVRFDLRTQISTRAKLPGYSWCQAGKINTAPPGQPKRMEDGQISIDRTLSPDGRYVATYDGDILLVDSYTGKIVRRIPLPQENSPSSSSPCITTRWTGDGQYVLVSNYYWKDLLCIRARDGQIVHNTSWSKLVGSGVCDWSPNNRFYLINDGRDLVLCDPLSGKVRRRIKKVLDASGDLPALTAVSCTGDYIYFQDDGPFGPGKNNLWCWPTVAEPVGN